MISSRNTLATIFLAISLVFPFSALAAVVENVWEEIDELIENDSGCGDATAFLLEGMVHRKLSTLRNGGLAVNVNVMGTFTPIDGSYAGEAAILRQNIHDVLPIFEEGVNAVHTIGETTRVITKGQVENYRLNYNFHVTFIGGEVKSYFETEKVSCS
jgi:hypothetical protein